MMLRNCQGLCFLTLCLLTIVCICHAQNAKSKKVSATYVWNRVKVLERKFEKTVKKLKDTQTTVNQLKRQIGRVQAAQSLFSDDPPCPERIQDFYHASAFNSCYHLEPKTVLVNHTHAEATCQQLSRKAHLVTIETAAEQKFLETKWKNERGIASSARFWTSAKRRAGVWRWTSTGRRINYQNWIPTTEHNDDRFLCMGVYSNEAYNWGDVACWAPHMVTCEINLLPHL